VAINVDEAKKIGPNGYVITDDDDNVLYYQTGGNGPPFAFDAPIGSRYQDATNNVRYRKMKIGTGVDAWAFDVPGFPFCVVDGGTLETENIMEAFDNAGGTALAIFPALTTVPFPSIRPGSELINFSFPNIGEIQFNEAGKFWVEGHVSFQFISGGFKTVAAVPQVDTGTGFVTVPGAFGWNIPVNAQLNLVSAPFGFLLDANIGDVVRVSGTIFSGGTVVNTAFGSSLRIKPVIPKSNVVPLVLDAGDYDGNPNKEPKSLIDVGEL